MKTLKKEEMLKKDQVSVILLPLPLRANMRYSWLTYAQSAMCSLSPTHPGWCSSSILSKTVHIST